MPIYEYECDNCGHTMEKIQRMSDDPLKDCPECQTSSLKKLISAAAFKLTGTGWYETDFKTKPGDKKVDGKSSAEGKSNSKDSKSDASKDTKKDNNKASSNVSKKDSQKVSKKDNKANSAGATKK